MTTNDHTRDEKIQYVINREAAKISALSSAKLLSMNILEVKKYYLLIKKQQQWNKLVSLILLWEKLLKNKKKTTEDQRKKQVHALNVLKPNDQELTIKSIIPEDILSDEAKNELNKIKEI